MWLICKHDRRYCVIIGTVFFLSTIYIYYKTSSFKYFTKEAIFHDITEKKSTIANCNLKFNGSLDDSGIDFAGKVDYLYKDIAFCLSSEQLRLYKVTQDLRPRLNTNYSGYTGPWLEDGIFCNWIKQYIYNYENRCNESSEIPPIYIPIFWTSLNRNKVSIKQRRDWLNNAQYVLNSLDPNLVYFTILQDAEGFKRSKLKLINKSNIIVFNSGGAETGLVQIPIPLIKGEISIDEKYRYKDIFASSTIIKKHFPVRKKLFEVIKFVNATNLSSDLNITSSAILDGKFVHYEGPRFREIIQRSLFHLCPRGFGRTSFRLYETIQLGTIPIYIWDDIEWIPYGSIFHEIGISLHVSQIEEIPNIVSNMSQSDINKKLENIIKLRPWFTYTGITYYILNILKKLPLKYLQKLRF
ncbi:exostosin family protein [Cryptosporidium muris RN66]|uniref:Exostosin family protein n=1 Tax=Cryptosporidium muris (strain RN66) TaxID=441375 RepID=B6AIB1_CRYMR|nr:exostosin family protein [Cryptosporidium muris RN66]EEA07952.1 exostosin family protein [Cryptosporidium muris RN66]|eukprot:XP_002142301.1 exostosin family protein [Cryptosporidium muris RN66]